MDTKELTKESAMRELLVARRQSPDFTEQLFEDPATVIGSRPGAITGPILAGTTGIPARARSGRTAPISGPSNPTKHRRKS